MESLDFFIFIDMSIPFFYIPAHHNFQNQFVLDEDTSRHVVQVLRMKKGEQLNLTNGEGHLLLVQITDDHKKHCEVRVIDTNIVPRIKRRISIAISLLKNPSRFEWFLEKAAEIGVNEIVPLLCERTEKEKFRHDRLNGILVSAMLQSQQAWLPVLHEPIAYDLFFKQEEVVNIQQKFIAHCEEGMKNELTASRPYAGTSLIMIGPEGDFSSREIELAIQNGFIAVSLGNTRLRAETAAVVAAVLLRNE